MSTYKKKGQPLGVIRNKAIEARAAFYRSRRDFAAGIIERWQGKRGLRGEAVCVAELLIELIDAKRKAGKKDPQKAREDNRRAYWRRKQELAKEGQS